MNPVAAELLAYGRELEAAGAAQVGGAFTGDASADALLESSANAFLLGVLFTQGIPAERAWAGPWELQQRLGTLDVGYLADHPDEVRAAFQRPPMLHRFKETLPRWVCSAAQRLIAEYHGDAANIWPRGFARARGDGAALGVRRHRPQEGRHGRRDTDAPLRGRARRPRVRAGRLRRPGEEGVPSQRACGDGHPSKRSRLQPLPPALRRPGPWICPRGLSAGRPVGPRCRCATSVGWVACVLGSWGCRSRVWGRVSRPSAEPDPTAAWGRSRCSSAASSRRRLRPLAAGSSLWGAERTRRRGQRLRPAPRRSP